jgi:hypothetical protein
MVLLTSGEWLISIESHMLVNNICAVPFVCIPLTEQTTGALTLNEFIFVIGAIKVMTICVVLFEAADTDASGVLESSEIKNVLTKLHENAGVDPPSDKDMDAMIKSVGGELTLEQFASVVIPLIIAAAGDPVIE